LKLWREFCFGKTTKNGSKGQNKLLRQRMKEKK
jgi:hypothetical protein